MEPLWVLLSFGAAVIPALLYFRPRNESLPASRLWVLSWLVLWGTGVAISLQDQGSAYYVLSNFTGPFFSGLLLAGTFRFLERPIPRWLAPTTIAISVTAGATTLVSNLLGGIASSLLEAPLVALACWYILRDGPPGVAVRWLGVVYFAIACLIGLDWLGQAYPETGNIAFATWMGLAITACFTQVLVFTEQSRNDASRHEREREFLLGISRIAVDPDGHEGRLHIALADLLKLGRLSSFGIWRGDSEKNLQFFCGQSKPGFQFPASLSGPNGEALLLRFALAHEAPLFVGSLRDVLPETLELAEHQNGFFASLRAGGELVGVMGGFFEPGPVVSSADRRFVTDLTDEIAFVLSHLSIRESQRQGIEQRVIEAQKLRAMIEAVPAGVLLFDPQGAIELISPLYCNLLQCGTPSDWVGRNAIELRRVIHKSLPTESREALNIMTRYMRPDEQPTTAGEIEILTGMGARLFITHHPVTGKRGDLIGQLWMARDVTEERRLAERVQFSERMQTVETLAGGLAHDFNNQLTTILGNASFLQHEIGSNPEAQRTLLDLARSAEYCAELTHGLLSFARQQRAEVLPVRLAEVLSQTALLMRPSFGPDHEFEVSLADDLGWIEADVGQLRRALINLLANARDATLGRGKIRLSAERSTDKSAFLIRVSDNGEGMSEETRRRAFEPFFTTKDTGFGTGLGLAIVYGIVESHGGQIEVKSKLRVGTTFTLTWPAREAPKTFLDQPPTPDTTIRGTILLAEDEPSVRRLVSRALEQAGYQVQAVGDGDAAVAEFRKQPDLIDLAVLDLSMPGRSGLSALREIREEAPELPVLIVSGHPQREQDDWPQDIPLLPKPFSPRTLVERVGEMIDASKGASA